MNYVEIHLGDYGAATFHLSPLEDGIYWRMLRVYYRDELPLPADFDQIERKVGARTDEEKAAVGVVLAEFFVETPEGWRQLRCDEELAAYRVLKDEADARRENEADRQRRHREQRAKLFEELRAHGIVPKYDTPTSVLRAELSRVHHGEVTANPSPNSQLPSPSKKKGEHPEKSKTPRKRAPVPARECPPGVATTTWEDWLCLRDKKRAPVTATVVVAAAREAAKAGMELDAFLQVWCLRGSQGLSASWLREDERRVVSRSTFAQQDAAERRARWEQLTGMQWPEAAAAIDITPAALVLEHTP